MRKKEGGKEGREKGGVEMSEVKVVVGVNERIYSSLVGETIELRGRDGRWRYSICNVFFGFCRRGEDIYPYHFYVLPP